MSTKSGLASIAKPGRADIIQVDPRDLHMKPDWNSRDMKDPLNQEHVDMLAQSIAQIGVKEPLTVFWEDGKAWVEDGHCRLLGSFRAIDHYKAELKLIPVKSGERYANEADRIFSQTIRNSGKRLSDLEQARNWKRLVNLGWQQGDIAKRAGISASRVSQILGLLTLPEPVKAMVVAGNVSPTLAVQTVAQNGSKAEQVLKAGLVEAQAEGKTKVTAANLTGESRKVNIRTLLKEFLDASDVDDDAEDFVVIKAPNDLWKKLRDESGW